MSNPKYRKSTEGLHALLEMTRKYADSFPKKVEAMQEVYLEKNIKLYNSKEKEQLRYYLKASNYKFYLATLSLEQLWSLSHTKKLDVFDAIKNSLDRLDCSNDDLLLITFAFEGFLFQSRAFIDFYMLYICLILKTNQRGKISYNKFYKALKNAPPQLQAKAINITNYFEKNVFAESKNSEINPENWGALIRSLRDKIAHRDQLRPSFDNNKRLAGQVLFNWPTIHKITYDYFFQYMQNGMFSLVEDTSPILYDVDWKPETFT